MRPTDRSFLTRLLLTTALPLALMTAGAAGVRAATVIVPTIPGSLDGANGASGEPGGDGQLAFAFAGADSDPLNSATATGGNGGAGGNGVGSGIGGAGGAGGGATAIATTMVAAGAAEADAFSNGGRGGAGGTGGSVSAGAIGGVGGNAIAISAATSGGSGIVSSTATAMGGEGGQNHNDGFGFAPWGTALAVSTARNSNGSVTTIAQLPANVSPFGQAIAETSAGVGTGPPAVPQVITFSNATLTPGGPDFFAGAMGAGSAGPGTYHAEADFNFTADLPDGLYLTLNPGDSGNDFSSELKIDFGGNTYDFAFANVEDAQNFFGNNRLHLASGGGQFFDLSYSLTEMPIGGFQFDYIVTVPEPSTWAMLLVGFAGLGFAGYRRSGKANAAQVAA
jgi:PEP-CTERM motif